MINTILINLSSYRTQLTLAKSFLCVSQAKDVVSAAGWPTIQVHPLNPSEKMEIITTYMSLYSKTLNEEQLATIVEAEQSNNPLYLKALLDEVDGYSI